MTPDAFFAAYDAFGERRAGCAGDRASAGWLRDIATATGARAALVEVPFRRFVPGPSFAEVDGRRIEGLPLFDGGVTGEAGVTGRLGPLGSQAPIGFAAMPPRMASLPDNAFARERAATRHAAIVVALESPRGGLAPLNAHDAARPFGPPVLQVAEADGAALGSASAPVRVVAAGAWEDSVSWNVRATLDGTNRPPLVLLTPRTSWWTSTAERAGGILAWLAALEALAAVDAAGRAPVVALASCGHELGHFGSHHAFAAEPALAAGSALVLHLGANLGAALAPRLVVRSNAAGLADRMAEALVAAGHPRAPLEVHTGGKAGGEAHEIESRGGRYLSLIGDNPWFHAPGDRWPESVDLERATSIARAVASLGAALAREAR